MPTFCRDGIELYYETAGDGPPLLLLAGLAADQGYWLPAKDLLAPHRRLILVDNRGSGRTKPLDAENSIEAMADDCMALLRHLGLTRVDIVGHSMGGMIAQACALRHPDGVGRLVLAATMTHCTAHNKTLFDNWARLFPLLERRAWFRNLFLWVLSRGFFTQPGALRVMLELATSYPHQQTPVALRRQVDALTAFDASAQVAGITAHALVLAGEEDLLFGAGDSAHFASLLPHATLVTIPGAAHSFPAEMPAKFAAHVLAFLDRR